MLARIWSSAVFWSFAVTALRTGGFLLVLPLVVRTLSPEELGFWYVLLGLVQASNLLELGFAPTVGRFASYYMVGAATIPPTGLPSAVTVSGTPNFPGLAGLARSAEKLYRFLGLAIGGTFFVFEGGWLAWRYPDTMRSAEAWLAFSLLGAGTGFAMSQFFWGALLAGMNQVREQQKIFFIGLMLNYLVVAAGILLGAGIFSLVLGQIVLGLVPRWKARQKVLALLPSQITGKTPEISWQILWPNTWRNSLIQVCSYLLLPASALTCAATTNLLVTAEYGLTLQMGLMIHGFSACWQAAKYPQVAAMLAAGRVREVGRIVRTRILLTFLTFGAGASTAFYFGPVFLEVIRSKTPFLPSAAFVLLLAAIGVDLWSGSFSALLQATNRTPHLPFFCLAAAVGFPLGFVLGEAYGPGGILGACILAQAAFCVWTLPGIWLRQLRGIRLSSLPA